MDVDTGITQKESPMKSIAILLATDRKADSVAGFPDDSVRFMDLLRLASDAWKFTVIAVHDNDIPASILEHDGVIITGSSCSVNAQYPWLERLFTVIREAHTQQTPLFGCCFGHQAIAKALGGEVSANPFGWSAGTEVTEIVRNESWLPAPGSSIRLYSAHREQVVRLPCGARVVGTNARCPIAAMAIGKTIFTTQYHPEMSEDFITALVESMQGELGTSVATARKSIESGSDMTVFSSCLDAFFHYAGNAANPSGETENRARFAEHVTVKAGRLAMEFFRDVSQLTVESKGVQDLVSNADRDVETLIRREINESFPDDGIIGEEYATQPGTSGFDWVIDPIDGTSNFVRGIPAWSVSIACAQNGRAVIGSLLDPVNNEHFLCQRESGAFLNGKAIQVCASRELSHGLMGVGTSHDCETNPVPTMIRLLMERDSMFVRSGSGALGLAYVSCGRYLGYIEGNMGSWDCLAGILLAEEAGAIAHEFDCPSMLENGGKVVVATPGVFHDLRAISRAVLET